MSVKVKIDGENVQMRKDGGFRKSRVEFDEVGACAPDWKQQGTARWGCWKSYSFSKLHH